MRPDSEASGDFALPRSKRSRIEFTVSGTFISSKTSNLIFSPSLSLLAEKTLTVFVTLIVHKVQLSTMASPPTYYHLLRIFLDYLSELAPPVLI